ncbi:MULTISPECIES: histidine phosphatase family protein [unclassified Curtobacterium]|uniref:histidine phosphatase family protein n=1 Tax=unclassified Curtobacterium TaxID=257496 RepID=UPI0008DCF083|nr:MULTISPECIES: histidine phosphatase family protein [unclassified Curtobacterium]MCT9620713.1 MSMEG_4193 family putative phosphomutase [Curtobacterium sp. C2H10]OII20596.1 histidine phosphatase [Curtobacterium sp. MCBA15_016]SFF61473.1 probable phosphomutase, MSMEG_4193 family [Curtobacterium sp. YR515]
MATVLLVRHGRTTANATGVLAGRTAGVALDAVGREQAARTAGRLAAVPLAAVVSSPLERCRQTARALLGRQAGEPETRIERAITECDYGDWQGRKLADLAKEPLWRTVQANPSAVVFPGGESMQGMQSRAVAAVRRIDAEVEAAHGPGAVWVAVSHGDVIKSVLADALGMHLDLFQRIAVGPASVSIVRYGEHRPEVVASNTESGDLTWLAAAPAPSADAAVGGGAGHDDPATGPAPAGA